MPSTFRDKEKVLGDGRLGHLALEDKEGAALEGESFCFVWFGAISPTKAKPGHKPPRVVALTKEMWKETLRSYVLDA